MPIEMDIDELQIYLGRDYQLTDKIIVHHPTITEVAEFGEQRYYSAVFMLTAIPSDMKFQLEDLGYNYMEVQDYDLFLYITRSLSSDKTSLLLGDLDLSKMQITMDESINEIVLVDLDSGARIDRYVWLRLREFLRTIHGIVPKIQKAANETTRKILIKLDREKAEKAAKSPAKSQLKVLISGLMRNPGCTLSFSEIKELPLYMLMDTIKGLQVFTSTNALLIGANSGMVDIKKIDKKEFDWMRDLQGSDASKIKLNAETQSKI